MKYNHILIYVDPQNIDRADCLSYHRFFYDSLFEISKKVSFLIEKPSAVYEKEFQDACFYFKINIFSRALCLLDIRIFLYFRMIFNNLIPFSKKNICKNFAILKRCCLFVSFLKKNKIDLFFSISCNSDRDLFGLTRLIGIKNVIMAHGSYYSESYETGSYFEWPTSNTICFYEVEAEYCKKKYGNISNFTWVGFPMWAIKFGHSIPKENIIVIYESNFPDLLKNFYMLIIKLVDQDKVFIKTHPWRVKNGLSIKNTNIKFNEFYFEINQKMPSLGVSMGSTVTGELVYNSIPVVTITESFFCTSEWPQKGTFLISNERDLEAAAKYVAELFSSIDKQNNLIYSQKKEVAFGNSPFSKDKYRKGLQKLLLFDLK